MRAFWITFWSLMGTFGALVGLYIGAAAEDLEWAFYLVVGGAVAVAGTRTLGPRLLRWSRAIQDYPVLLQRAGALETEVTNLKSDKQELAQRAKELRGDGIKEGRSQILGSLKAASAKVPKIVGVTTEDDRVYILAKCSPDGFIVGARYEVQFSLTGDVKGVVEAAEYDTSKELAALLCVDATHRAFWAEIVKRAEIDPEATSGIRLAPAPWESEWTPSEPLAIESTTPLVEEI